MRELYPNMYWCLVQLLPPDEVVEMLKVAHETKKDDPCWAGDSDSPVSFCQWWMQGKWVETWAIVAELYLEERRNAK